MKKKTMLLGILALAVVLGGWALLRHRPQKAGKYRTGKVDRGDVTMTVSATGTLSAVTTVQVGSQVSGIIARLHADFNSRVGHGQLLAELDPTPFEQAVAQQRANLEKAKVDAANAKIASGRQEKLQAQGLAAQADYDNAKAAADAAAAQVALAQAALAQAETNLRNSRIVSPIDGVVVNRAYDVGQTVAASFQAPTLFTIAQDLTKMQVQADVDESDIGRVKLGQTAHFTVDSYPDRQFTAKVSQIRLNATVNQNVVTYPVIIEVANPEELLRPSMTANVTVEVGTVKDVLRVPNAALRFKPPLESGGAAAARREAGGGGPGGAGVPGGQRPGLGEGLGRPGKPAGPVVYVLGPEDRLMPVSVRLGITDGQMTEVTGGDLEEGQQVVTGLATTKSEQTGPRMRF